MVETAGNRKHTFFAVRCNKGWVDMLFRRKWIRTMKERTVCGGSERTERLRGRRSRLFELFVTEYTGVGELSWWTAGRTVRRWFEMRSSAEDARARGERFPEVPL